MTQSSGLHVGIIMDGNRRWAKAQGLKPLDGHKAGYKTLKRLLEELDGQEEVSMITVYAFSTENWKRPSVEIKGLMALASRAIKDDLEELVGRGIRLRAIGSEEGVPKSLMKAIKQAEEDSKDNDRYSLNACFNYGGRKEIVDAVRTAVSQGLDPEQIDEDTISGLMYQPEVPDIDLVIRTSGEQRISGFMTWRTVYSEFCFVDKHWPDFTIDDFNQAVSEYNKRDRRVGK